MPWAARVLLLVAAAGGVAPAAAPRDVKAVVRGIEQRYQRARTLKATFLERYAQGRGNLRVEAGTVYFSRPGRMRWEYQQPEAKFFLSDGRTVWFYVPADRTVTRARIRDSADWRTPLVLLTGKARLSRFCRRVERAEARPTSPDNVALRCLPRGDAPGDDAPGIREVLLEVDPDFRLVRILVREAGDVETEFRFADWQENLPLAEVLFHFQAPPGVAIVDEASIAGPAR